MVLAHQVVGIGATQLDRNEDKQMSNKFLKSMTIMALCAGLSLGFTACGGDDDDETTGGSTGGTTGGSTGGGNKPTNTKPAKDYTITPGQLNPTSATTPETAKNSPSCAPEAKETDTSLTNFNEIVNYLVGTCTISEYFQLPTFKDNKGGLGDPCFCYGEDCVMAGYQRPEAETIYGCQGLDPVTQPGAVKGCFRSTSAKGIKPEIYFPNGMCTIMMSNCQQTDSDCSINKNCKVIKEDYVNPNADRTKEVAQYDKSSYICGFATFGDWSKKSEFTSCPHNGVLSDFDMPIAVYMGPTLSSAAKLDATLCLQPCETDNDCHGSKEYDAIIGEAGQMKCVSTKDLCRDTTRTVVDTKVCFDTRVSDQSSIGLCAMAK